MLSELNKLLRGTKSDTQSDKTEHSGFAVVVSFGGVVGGGHVQEHVVGVVGFGVVVLTVVVLTVVVLVVGGGLVVVVLVVGGGLVVVVLVVGGLVVLVVGGGLVVVVLVVGGLVVLVVVVFLVVVFTVVGFKVVVFVEESVGRVTNGRFVTGEIKTNSATSLSCFDCYIKQIYIIT